MPALARRVEADVVLFSSWWGKLADSPMAIADELRRRDAPLRQVWVLEDVSAAPDGAVAVRPGTVRYLLETGRARYLVSNTTLPGYFRKKSGSTYLQTWHGTPLKRIGFDIERPAFPDSARYLDDLRREVDEWDFLVSPNRFSTEIFRGAFHYQGEIIETGYPRNDVLVGADSKPLRERVRERLGIARGKRAVLYAPTWRDDAQFSTELDTDTLASGLGDGWVVLVRAHTSVASTLELADGPRVRNVSRLDDIGPLLLAADVLVTDYSSVMFDFAATGKPMVFFTYDLERYRDEVRGFYFDLADDAPGPLVRTTTDLVDAVRDVHTSAHDYAAAYARFRQRFCHLDDGRAAARVVDEVFEL